MQRRFAYVEIQRCLAPGVIPQLRSWAPSIHKYLVFGDRSPQTTTQSLRIEAHCVVMVGFMAVHACGIRRTPGAALVAVLVPLPSTLDNRSWIRLYAPTSAAESYVDLAT